MSAHFQICKSQQASFFTLLQLSVGCVWLVSICGKGNHGHGMGDERDDDEAWGIGDWVGPVDEDEGDFFWSPHCLMTSLGLIWWLFSPAKKLLILYANNKATKQKSSAWDNFQPWLATENEQKWHKTTNNNGERKKPGATQVKPNLSVCVHCLTDSASAHLSWPKIPWKSKSFVSIFHSNLRFFARVLLKFFWKKEKLFWPKLPPME